MTRIPLSEEQIETIIANMSEEQLAMLAAQRESIRAQWARDDPCHLFEYTMLEETKMTPLKCAPHQVLMLRFQQAHPLCVIRGPVGCSKSFLTILMSIASLGDDPTSRGLFVGATHDIAIKQLSKVAEYIADPMLSIPLRVVYPDLIPHQTKDWNQSKIYVDRPPGIRDASVQAVGLETKFTGSRIKFAVCDDAVTLENSRTQENRDYLHERFDGNVLSRLDPDEPRCAVVNTPWNEDDLTYRLIALGWPAITLDAYGFIELHNVNLDDPVNAEIRKLIRLSTTQVERYRLTAHDPDPNEDRTLWDVKYPLNLLLDLEGKGDGSSGRKPILPHMFAANFMCRAVNDATSLCPSKWTRQCLKNGRGIPLIESVTREELDAIDPRCCVITGVDLAGSKPGKKGKNARTVLFTLLAYPNGDLQVLRIKAGNFRAPDIRDEILYVHNAFGSIVFVEDNATQSMLIEFVGEDTDVQIWPHNTNSNKWDPNIGIQTLVFHPMFMRKWIIPSVDGQPADKEIGRWLAECRSFVPDNSKHSGDTLMASWIAAMGAKHVRKDHAFFFETEEDGADGVYMFDGT